MCLILCYSSFGPSQNSQISWQDFSLLKSNDKKGQSGLCPLKSDLREGAKET